MPLQRLLLFLLCLSICGRLPVTAQSSSPAADDYSGMYSFLKEGEFMQITIEDKGKISGFISRFGDTDSDKGNFIDQFFKSGSMEGAQITFTTETVHGVWFQFEGNFVRGPGKRPDEEAYYVLKGTLTRNSNDSDKQKASQAAKVEFKSFPRDTKP